jgi:hypothetical protein
LDNQTLFPTLIKVFKKRTNAQETPLSAPAYELGRLRSLWSTLLMHEQELVVMFVTTTTNPNAPPALLCLRPERMDFVLLEEKGLFYFIKKA